MKEKAIPTRLEEARTSLANEVLNFKEGFVKEVITILSEKTSLPLADMMQKCNDQELKDYKKMSIKGKIVRRFFQGDIPLIRIRIEFYSNNTFSIFLNGNGGPAKEDKLTIKRIDLRVVSKI